MDQHKFNPGLFHKEELSKEEKELLERYLAEPEFKSDLDALLLNEWDITSSDRLEDVEILSRYKSLKQKIKPVNPYVNTYRVAASLLLVCVFAIGFIQREKLYNQLFPIKYTLINSKAGEQKTISLPDGSKVWLNASSSIRYPENFRGNLREITLEGEAFFEVFHDEDKPFIVHTKRLFTKVLGTSFNIEAYPDDSTIDVTVATGRVSVSVANTVSTAPKSVALLTKNHHIMYNLEMNRWIKDSVASEANTAWHQGKLVFRHTTVRDVIKTLERWYAVKINTQSTSKHDPYVTADFKTGTPIHHVLETFKLTGLIDYSLTNTTIDIIIK